MGNFSIMNNTPYHFLIASVMLVVFFIAVFTKNKDLKPKLVTAMKVIFVLLVLSGCYVWLLVPFSIPLLVKSLGGIFLFWVMLQLTKNPKSTLYWVLFVATAAVGLTLAFFYI